MKVKEVRNQKTAEEIREEKFYLKEFTKKYSSKEDEYFEKMEKKRNRWF